MEDILFWIFISTTAFGLGTLTYLLYKEMFDPYDGYDTFAEYYIARTKGELKNENKR